MLIIGGIPIIAGMLFFERGETYQPLSGRAWLAVGNSAIVPMILCYLIWYTLVGMLPTMVAAISTLAIPIVGVYSSALLLDEQVGPREWFALLLVVSALAVVVALPSITGFLRRGD